VELLQRGLHGRQTQATKANAASSRSHCIFAADITLHVLQGGAPQTLSSTLTLVDLAGGHLPAVCVGLHDLVHVAAHHAVAIFDFAQKSAADAAVK
jgi:Kinesin motor domain